MAGRETLSAPDFFIRSLGLCGLLLSAIALAVESTPEMARLARYAGADREQVLVRGAQKEGEVTLYAGTQINDMRPVIQAFTKKYGVRVNFWRAGREEILNRVVNETRSGRTGADVIEQSSLTLEMLHREGLLQKVESPAFPTLSHKERASLGVTRLRLMAARAVLPVYALGGVNAQTAQRLAGARLAGIAAIEGLLPDQSST